MSKPITIPALKGDTLSAIHNGPAISKDRKILFLMAHDFPGTKAGNNGLFADIEGLLADKNLHTLRYDARGCGESAGKETDFTLATACDDFKAVLAWADTQDYERFVFIGEGVGATQCILNLSFNVMAQVLFWPVLNPAAYVRNLYSGQSSAFIDGMLKTDLMPALETVITPTLILHGTEDDVVPISQLDLARKHMRSKRIDITTFHDGGHGLQQMNHRKAIFFHLIQFVEKYA